MSAASRRLELLWQERESLLEAPGGVQPIPLDARGQLTREAVADSPWSAAAFPLPPDPSPEMMDDAKIALLHCREKTAEILGTLDPKADRYQRDRAEQGANMDLIMARLKEVDALRDIQNRMPGEPDLKR